MAEALTIGQRVTWLYQPRGGYGYTVPVDARVVRFSRRGRPVIEVRTVAGEAVTRCVLAESLRAPHGVPVTKTTDGGQHG